MESHNQLFISDANPNHQASQNHDPRIIAFFPIMVFSNQIKDFFSI